MNLTEDSNVASGNQALYEYTCPPSQWSQVPPQYMPWGHTPAAPAAPLVTFTAQPTPTPGPSQADMIFQSTLNLPQPSSSSFGHRLPFHCKRKAELDFTMRPTKQHITEEKMAAHMSRLHISSETAPEDLTPPEIEDATYREKRLYVCEEMRRLQTESILPSSLLGRLERPCMAVMLWQPPTKIPNPISGSTTTSVAQAMAQVPRRTDDENDNDESTTDLNCMDLES